MASSSCFIYLTAQSSDVLNVCPMYSVTSFVSRCCAFGATQSLISSLDLTESDYL